ncbi:MAG: uroporphyrinogen decarboxylase [Verrucomicrobiales bacterium]|nr:uroporphyrinogen decarboxylase [Verrucomicrobiales bacterium]
MQAESPNAPAAANAPKVGSARERFLRACACLPNDYPPVWLMRQAGRVLPEYRALKERYSFLELVRTPDLATEVTLQPIRRFGFDAAIIFSDILVIPEALGQPYRFADTGGVHMDFTFESMADIHRLETGRVRERLGYVADALRLVRRELGGRHALIGFSGSPWTLANFMLEGGSSKNFSRALAMLRSDRELYDALCERLTGAIIEYLSMQIDAGAEVLQIFDTLAGLLPDAEFEPASARWIRQIIQGLGNRVPIIVFSKGAHGQWRTLVGTGANILSVDASADLAALRVDLPTNIGIQGNLDPEILTRAPEEVARQTVAILQTMRGRPGHIFNLGHGVPPTAPLHNLSTLVDTIRTFS